MERPPVQFPSNNGPIARPQIQQTHSNTHSNGRTKMGSFSLSRSLILFALCAVLLCSFVDKAKHSKLVGKNAIVVVVVVCRFNSTVLFASVDSLKIRFVRNVYLLKISTCQAFLFSVESHI